MILPHQKPASRGRVKCDGTRTENRFRPSTKRTTPFKTAGSSVQLITGSQGVRISGSNAGYTMFRGSVKGTGYTLHSTASPSLPLPCVTVCHYISTGVYSPHLQLGGPQKLSETLGEPLNPVGGRGDTRFFGQTGHSRVTMHMLALPRISSLLSFQKVFRSLRWVLFK